jgi:hypothetical protein
LQRPARLPRGKAREPEQEHERGGCRQEERGLEEPELMVRQRCPRRVIHDRQRQQEECGAREKKDREEEARRAFARVSGEEDGRRDRHEQHERELRGEGGDERERGREGGSRHRGGERRFPGRVCVCLQRDR